MSNNTCDECGGITWDLTGPDGDMGEYCPTCRDAELTRLREENERLKGLLGVNMAPVEVHHGKCSGDVPGVVCLGCEDAIVNILHERIENLRGERMDLLADTAKQAKREALEEAAKSLSVFQTAYTSAMMESYHQLRRDGHDDTVLESSADWILEIGSQCVRFLEALAHPPEPEKPCETCGGSGLVDSGGQTPWGAWIDMPCPDCQGKEEVKHG